jgi:hypothetical protein
MLRLLVLALVVVVLLLLLEAFLRRLRAAFGVPRRAAGGAVPGAAPQRSLDRLVACAACGVRIPERRALPAQAGSDRFYCSETCRRDASRAAS